jgi:hypothetical protein
MYGKHKTMALSCDHFYSGKAIGIARSGCVFVALVIQHEMHMHHIAICDLSGSTIFCIISHKWQDFGKTNVIVYKNVFSDFL